MPSDFWFRFSTYLSQALACACLGYAEWEALPEVTAFSGVVILLLAASFLLNRRFELSLGKANLLGLGIGVLAVVWMAYNITRPNRHPTSERVEWPANMLPVIAPVLMVLIPAKLFRPKHVGDWWGMHGVGLAAVALATAMTDDAAFVGFLAAYIVCTCWSLILFFYRRSGGVLPPVPGRPAPPPPLVLTTGPLDRGPKGVFARSVVWLLLAAAVALPLFFVIPRSGYTAWSFSRGQFEVGQSAESKLDLKQGGEQKATDEIAYTFTAVDARGHAYADLPTDQFWRARAFSGYSAGELTATHLLPTLIEPLDARMLFQDPNTVFPDPAEFGPTGLLIEFTPGQKEVYPVLAAPVGWVGGKSSVRWAPNGGVWPQQQDTAFRRANTDLRLGRYRQVFRPGTADGLSQPFQPAPGNDIEPLLRLTDALPYAREYADTLLARLIADGELPAAARRADDPRGHTDPDHHERIARLFSDHLAGSGLFTYSTTIKAVEGRTDPVEHMLRDSRTGDCKWFAAALVVLLRAVGVPCQMVSGYKGWETDEDNNMVIRRRMAHMWVEVLVRRPAPPDFPFRPNTPPDQRKRVWHWLTLDPTTADVRAAPAKSWFEQGASFLADFIIGYDREKQRKTVEDATAFAVRFGPVLGVLLLAAVFGRLAARRYRERHLRAAAAAGGPDWYARHLNALARFGLTPRRGETPMEFAVRAADGLRDRHVPAVDVPGVVAAALYRARYEGVPLTDAELQAVTAAVDRLDQARPAPAGARA